MKNILTRDPYLYPSLKEMKKAVKQLPAADRRFSSPMDFVMYAQSENTLHIFRASLKDLIPVAEELDLELVGLL